MRNELEEMLLAAFEKAFDAALTGPETVRVPRIDLDLRVASEQDLATDLPDLIYRQLGERLRSALERAQSVGGAEGPDVRTPREDRFETLMHYLRTGSLPWSAAGVAGESTGLELRATCAAEVSRLVDILRSGGADVAFIFRLLQLLDDDAMPALARTLLADAPEGTDVERIVEILSQPGVGRGDWLHHAATLLSESLNALKNQAGAAEGFARSASGASEEAASSDGSVGGEEAADPEMADIAADLKDIMTELEGLRNELSSLMTGESMLAEIGALLEGVADTPGSREQVESVEEMMKGLDGALDRPLMLRIMSGLVAGLLRGASSATELYDGAGIVVRMLAELSADDARAFLDGVLECVASPWKADVLALAYAVLESEPAEADRRARLRAVSAIVAESVRGRDAAAPPDLASAVAWTVTPEEYNAIAVSLPEPLVRLLAPDGAASGDRRSAASGIPSSGEANASAGAPGQATGAPSPGERPDGAPDAPAAGRGGDPSTERAPSAIPPSDYSLPFASPFASAFDSPQGAEFPMNVSSAGLVILHSFIVPLLTNTGIIEAGTVELSPAAAARAASLLHFVATGREEAYEYELGFIKVLLGFDVERPLFLTGGLTGPAEMEEAEGLLDAVIGYWTMLKNTSRDGLRTGFLQRGGLLRMGDDGWRLHVEHASFDMLLGSLPWGISMVKLPWMAKPLHVEWERQ